MAVKSWKIVLSFGLPWAMFMTVFGTLLQGTLSYLIVICSIAAGAFAGWVFSILIRYAASSLYESIVVEVSDDEQLLKQGGASRFVAGESVGGKLVLTNKQLIFKPHMMNSQTHQFVIFLSLIEKVKVTRAFGILSKGLCVVLRNHESHKFVVHDPKLWVNCIERQLRGITVIVRKVPVADKVTITTVTN